MTISYTGDICSTHSWSFLRVIFRWRGSVWKSVLTELCIWLLLYYAVMFLYRTLLGTEARQTFERMAEYTGRTADYIPLNFILGFFVKIVVDRWREMFSNIGFIDSVAHLVSTIIRGDDPATVAARRNIMRYLCLVQVLVLRDISVKVRRRFPGMDAVQEAGLIQAHERRLIDSVDCAAQYGKHWLPHNWVCQLCARLREQGHISSDPLLSTLLRELILYRERLQKLINFDLVPIPLAYPQVVFISVRTYFLICLFSRQNLEAGNVFLSSKSTTRMEWHIPLMTILQFIFYMGWVKVAEALLNPLGEDDDDFETLFVIERNIAISALLAEQCHDQVPDQELSMASEFTQNQKLGQPFKSDKLTAQQLSGNPTVHALIGSAVRVMQSGTQSAREGGQGKTNSWRRFRRGFSTAERSGRKRTLSRTAAAGGEKEEEKGMNRQESEGGGEGFSTA